MAKRDETAGDRISEAEHAVMEVLWERSPQSAAEVCEQVCTARDWSMPTVKTLLARLVTKGAVATEADGRRFLYSPMLQRSDYVGTESRRLLNRLFAGKPASLLAQLAESEELTDSDLSEIERLLQELRS